jgi:hypothetical protein
MTDRPKNGAIRAFRFSWPPLPDVRNHFINDFLFVQGEQDTIGSGNMRAIHDFPKEGPQ